MSLARLYRWLFRCRCSLHKRLGEPRWKDKGLVSFIPEAWSGEMMGMTRELGMLPTSREPSLPDTATAEDSPPTSKGY